VAETTFDIRVTRSDSDGRNRSAHHKSGQRRRPEPVPEAAEESEESSEGSTGRQVDVVA